MQHEFTDAQIPYAADDATEETTSSYKAVGLPYLRPFLSSLPDQPGDDALLEQAGLYKDLLDHPFFKDWSISGTSIRSFMMNKLDSAMTPQDDWQECAFEDIQKGDRVKKVTTKEGTTETLEGTASQRLGKYTKSWANDQDRLIFDNHEFCDQLVRYYRIPAPVVAPDPAEHPVILIHRSSGIKHVPPAVAITRKNNMTDDIHYVFNDYGVQSPADITEWEPAKVVADDD